jgi:hypothetical protein
LANANDRKTNANDRKTNANDRKTNANDRKTNANDRKSEVAPPSAAHCSQATRQIAAQLHSAATKFSNRLRHDGQFTWGSVKRARV